MPAPCRAPEDDWLRDAALAKRVRDRAPEASVTQDDRVHVVLLVEGPGAEASPVGESKSRGHRSVSAAPGASVPWRPSAVVCARAVRAPGPVPPGRAARASS